MTIFDTPEIKAQIARMLEAKEQAFKEELALNAMVLPLVTSAESAQAAYEMLPACRLRSEMFQRVISDYPVSEEDLVANAAFRKALRDKLNEGTI